MKTDDQHNTNSDNNGGNYLVYIQKAADELIEGVKSRGKMKTNHVCVQQDGLYAWFLR